MFPPLCRPPAICTPNSERSATPPAACWRSCSRTRSSWRPNSRWWAAAAPASRRWSGAVIGRRGGMQAAFKDLYRQLSASQLGITVVHSAGLCAEDTVAQLFRDWFAALPLPRVLARGGGRLHGRGGNRLLPSCRVRRAGAQAWAITHPERTSRWIPPPSSLFSWITRPSPTSSTERQPGGAVAGAEGHQCELEHPLSRGAAHAGGARAGSAAELDADDARCCRACSSSGRRPPGSHEPRYRDGGPPGDLTLEEAADQVAVAGRSRYPCTASRSTTSSASCTLRISSPGLRSAKGAACAPCSAPPFSSPGRGRWRRARDMSGRRSTSRSCWTSSAGRRVSSPMEDLLEEIVGQIYDEYDRPSASCASRPPAWRPSCGLGPDPRGQQRVRAGAGRQDYTTVGGFLFGASAAFPGRATGGGEGRRVRDRGGRGRPRRHVRVLRRGAGARLAPERRPPPARARRARSVRVPTRAHGSRGRPRPCRRCRARVRGQGDARNGNPQRDVHPGAESRDLHRRHATS